MLIIIIHQYPDLNCADSEKSCLRVDYQLAVTGSCLLVIVKVTRHQLKVLDFVRSKGCAAAQF